MRGLAAVAAAVALTAIASTTGCRQAAAQREAGVDAGAVATKSAPPTFPAPADVAAPPSDARVLASGVAMKDLRAGGGGAHAEPDDCVKVSFVGWKRDGSLQGVAKHDAPVVQCLPSAVPGLAAALREMTVGEAARIWVPGDQTFSPSKPGDEAPRGPLTYDVELLGIVRAPSLPADGAKPPASAVHTASGLAYVVSKAGTGTMRPGAQSRVTVEFSGWTKDGALIGTTATAGRPAVFSMSDVIPGWREALGEMVAGEKRRLWVPARLGFGEKGRRGTPSGDLVYELELVSVE